MSLPLHVALLFALFSPVPDVSSAAPAWVLVETREFVGPWAVAPERKMNIQSTEGRMSFHFRNQDIPTEFGCAVTWEGGGMTGHLARLIPGERAQLSLSLSVTHEHQTNYGCLANAAFMSQYDEPGRWSGGSVFFDPPLEVAAGGQRGSEQTGRAEVPAGRSGQELYLRIWGGIGAAQAQFGYYYVYRWQEDGGPTPGIGGGTGGPGGGTGGGGVDPSSAAYYAGTWSTSFGTVNLQGSPTLSGSYSGDGGGNLYLTPSAGGLSGIWTQPNSGQRCAGSQQGSNYWGRVTFRVSPDGRSLQGTWGYCDSDQGGAWTANREGPVPTAGGPGGGGAGGPGGPAMPSTAGMWDTTYGAIELRGSSELSGAYRDGTLYLTQSGSTLSGYWVQSNSGQRCGSDVRGSAYWGRITLTLDAGGRTMTGRWGYCDGTQDQGWNFTRR